MHEFQGWLDGDEYRQNERKCNFTCVFFHEIIIISEQKLFPVSVINPFEHFLSNWILLF